MATTPPGALGFAQLSTSPSAPPAGYCIIYSKTDNILYLQDSAGIEVALGSASGITALTGEATATGPGSAAITLSNSAVIGKVLTGFVSGPNSVVLATDSILQAVQKLQGQISATSGAAITSLTGDVTGTGPGATAATVAFVGGKSAASVATSVDDTQDATSINTASRIVKRDASGNFAANVITASLTGDVTGNVTGNVTGSAGSFTGALAGDVTGLQGSTAIASSVVTGKLLTGLVAGANTPIVATDSLLTAFANLQAQVTATSGAAITALSGDVVATGPGSVASTIQANVVSNSKLSQMPTLTFKGNNTGSTADPLDLTVSQVTSVLNNAALPVQIGTSNFAGASQYLALADHVHSHGNQTVGTLHAAATGSVNGFMSSADKTKLDASTSDNTVSTIVQRSAAGLVELTTQQLNGSTSGNVQLKAADTTTSYVLKFPSVQGPAGTYLSNDGAGNLSWSTAVVNIDGGRSDSVFVIGANIVGGTP